jgi:uncharacterized protein (DUF2141 family)
MLHKRFFISIFVVGFPWFVFSQNRLTVDVSNLRNTSGCVFLSVYNTEDGFPDNPEKAIKKGKLSPIKAKSVTYFFDDLPAGSYAVSVFHDEDCNGEMKTNILGIPLEGSGASNDARGKFGPPRYKDARFTLEGNKKITIKMWYF